MLLHDLMHNFCHPEAKLETLLLPSTFKMEERERFEEVKNAESVSTMIHNAHRVLKSSRSCRHVVLPCAPETRVWSSCTCPNR
jgi:hypothetical protein